MRSALVGVLILAQGSSGLAVSYWLSQPLASQLRSGEEVMRCRAVTPYPPALVSSEDGTVSDFRTKTLIDATLDGSFLAAKGRGEKLAYERSNPDEIRQALLQEQLCVQRLVAADEQNLEPATSIELENRVLLARDTIQMALAENETDHPILDALVAGGVFASGPSFAYYMLNGAPPSATSFFQRQKTKLFSLANRIRRLKLVRAVLGPASDNVVSFAEKAKRRSRLQQPFNAKNNVIEAAHLFQGQGREKFHKQAARSSARLSGSTRLSAAQLSGRLRRSLWVGVPLLLLAAAYDLYRSYSSWGSEKLQHLIAANEAFLAFLPMSEEQLRQWVQDNPAQAKAFLDFKKKLSHDGLLPAQRAL